MTYIIAEPCIDVRDKSCVDVCPVDCIHPTDGEGEPMLYIDPDECIDCGACEPECPVEAIFTEEDLPEEWSRFTEINANYFELKDSPEKWSHYKEDHAKDLEKKS
jgi:ferredoxin